MPYEDSFIWNGLFILLSFLIASYTYFKKSLTMSGAIVAFFVASFLYLSGGALFFSGLMFFFFSSTLIGKLGKKTHQEINQIHQKSGTRDVIQVLANSGVAVVMAIIFIWTREVRFQIAVMVSLAVSTADTWASEIGVLSKKTPISILRWRNVQTGISGGVTGLGIAASFLGASSIAVIYGLFQLPSFEVGDVQFIIIIGFLGSILDSLLGDTMQAKYQDDWNHKLTEKPISNGVQNRLVQGFSWMTNDLVNLLSIAIATSLFVLLF